jgi:hypothetical protein
MSRPIIPYHLHDSAVVTTRLEKADRWVLELELYPLSYPQPTTIQLIFSGIRNTRAVAAFQREVTALMGKSTRLGYRVDAFTYATDSVGQDQPLSLYLALDHLPPLTIECAKFHFVVSDG